MKLKITILLFVLLQTGVSCIFAQTAKNKQDLSISGHGAALNDGDTLILNLYKFGKFDYCILSKTAYLTTVKKHSFYFQISNMIDSMQYIDLYFPGKNIKSLNGYIAERGSNITLKYSGNEIGLSGLGYIPFLVKKKIDSLESGFIRKLPRNQIGLLEYAGYFDSLNTNKLKVLSPYRKLLNSDVYQMMYADIFGGTMQLRSYFIGQYLEKWHQKPQQLSGFSTLTPDSNNNFARSESYAAGIIASYKLDSCVLSGKQFELSKAYSFFKSYYANSVKFRERVVSLLLFSERSNETVGPLVEDALKFVEENNNRDVLKSIQRSFVRGATAYQFSLPDERDAKVILSNFRGKVVLLDFWFTGCSSCIKIKPSLERLEEELNSKNIVFLSVNIDKSKKLWLSSLKSKKYTTRYSINLFTEGLALDHPIAKHYNINGCPSIVLIDGNGRLITMRENLSGFSEIELNKLVTSAVNN